MQHMIWYIWYDIDIWYGPYDIHLLKVHQNSKEDSQTDYSSFSQSNTEAERASQLYDDFKASVFKYLQQSDENSFIVKQLLGNENNPILDAFQRWIILQWRLFLNFFFRTKLY